MSTCTNRVHSSGSPLQDEALIQEAVRYRALFEQHVRKIRRAYQSDTMADDRALWVLDIAEALWRQELHRQIAQGTLVRNLECATGEQRVVQ